MWPHIQGYGTAGHLDKHGMVQWMAELHGRTEGISRRLGKGAKRRRGRPGFWTCCWCGAATSAPRLGIITQRYAPVHVEVVRVGGVVAVGAEGNDGRVRQGVGWGSDFWS